MYSIGWSVLMPRKPNGTTWLAPPWPVRKGNAGLVFPLRSTSSTACSENWNHGARR